MIKLRYGNTNTFYIPGSKGGLLIDTDWAGTLPQFFKAIKSAGLGISDISYVLATHYHPDHVGIMPFSFSAARARNGSDLGSIRARIRA